ncbi:MAG: dihydrofolate reductase [Vigna little leaf phytoplasma]|nr:dihydrofolate reductase [Vigna little leaf phytoplasma]
MINLIAAIDANFVIGIKNKLPWHFKEDLLFFKKKTFQKNVIMGYKTYLSLTKYYGSKPFSFKNIYVACSSQNKLFHKNIIIIPELKYFLQQYRKCKEEIFVIGGGMIFHQAIPYVEIMYLTHILARYEGDCFFPYFIYSHYKIKEKKVENKLIFVTYQKIKEKNYV